MLKKLIWTGAIVAVVGLATFGADLWSYVKTGVGWVTSSIRGQVPLDFEIQRAKDMIAGLTPEIEANIHAIAEEEVGVEQLRAKMERTEARLAVERRRMKTLREAVASGTVVFTFQGRSYDLAAVKADLGRRLAVYKRAEATLATERRVLAAREKMLEASQQKLTNMHQAKRDLVAQVAELEAQWKMVQAVQAAGRFEMDESRLATARKTLDRLQHRLQVARKLIEKEGLLTEGIPVDETEVKTDIVAEVDALLSKS